MTRNEEVDIDDKSAPSVSATEARVTKMKSINWRQFCRSKSTPTPTPKCSHGKLIESTAIISTTTLLLLAVVSANFVQDSSQSSIKRPDGHQIEARGQILPDSEFNFARKEPQVPSETSRLGRHLRSSNLLASDGDAGHVDRISGHLAPLSLALQSERQQRNHPDAPKIVPLSALDRYQEGADLRLFCSASAPQSGGRIHFEWRKNNQPEQLADTPTSSLAKSSAKSRQQQQLAGSRVHISLVDEDSASVLRLNHLEAEDSGNYTCLARNQFGFDTSTVRVNVNVRLKWIKEPPSELQVRAGKSVQLECDASGQPAPLITWTSLKDRQSINSKVLRLDRVQVNDSGLYECRATSSQASSSGSSLASHLFASLSGSGSHLASEELLRKVVKLTVNGKYGGR